MVEHWLKDGKRCLEHTELTYDLAQRTLITAKRGAKNLPLCQCIELNLIFEWDSGKCWPKSQIL